jgi:hypothetical protein
MVTFETIILSILPNKITILWQTYSFCMDFWSRITLIRSERKGLLHSSQQSVIPSTIKIANSSS